MKRQFIIYDGRAIHETEKASILGICHTIEEAEVIRRDREYGEVNCYSYEDKEGILTDERFEF